MPLQTQQVEHIPFSHSHLGRSLTFFGEKNETAINVSTKTPNSGQHFSEFQCLILYF